jgi:lipopolysaccharide/colanic/teichoic acid biosynthesis glycosyltransferase
MIRLFKVSVPSSAVALVISEALLLFSCYLFAAWLLVDVPLVVFLFDQGGYWHTAFITAVIMLGLYFNDLYEDHRVASRIELIQRFCMAVGIAFLLESLVSYARWNVLLPKWVMVYGSLLALVVLPLWRMVFAAQVATSLGARRLLFLGSSPAAREIVAYLAERPELGLASIGYLEDDRGTPEELPGAAKLGSIAQLDEVVAEQRPARVIVGLESPGALPVERLLELRLAGLEIEAASDTYEMVFRRLPTLDVAPSQLVFSNEMNPSATTVTLQSAYSLILSLAALIVTIPVMAVVALIVKLTSPGPVLSRRQCAGLNGVPFTLLRFRPAGNWMRKLEGLPQLFNVLRGEMAIVGPRAERPEFIAVLEEKIPFYRQRLCVKPGLTGWARLNLKDSGALEDAITKLQYDRYYIKHLSISLDAYIIFHAVKAAVFGR